jgi:hypothetical protein
LHIFPKQTLPLSRCDRLILDWLTQRHYPNRSVQAEVHTENSRLKLFFEQCGFSQSTRDGEWIVYEYGE